MGTPSKQFKVWKGWIFVLYRDYNQYEDQFLNWYHLSMKKFDWLLAENDWKTDQKTDTNFREAISPEEQLCIMIM